MTIICGPEHGVVDSDRHLCLQAGVQYGRIQVEWSDVASLDVKAWSEDMIRE